MKAHYPSSWGQETERHPDLLHSRTSGMRAVGDTGETQPDFVLAGSQRTHSTRPERGPSRTHGEDASFQGRGKSLFLFPRCFLLAAGKESGCLPSFGRFYSTQSANSNPRNLTQCGIELIVVWWISSKQF